MISKDKISKKSTNPSDKISVTFSMGDRSEVYLISRTAALGKALRTCKTRNELILPPPVVFNYQGRTLTDRDVPEDLNMMDGTVITVTSRGLSG